MRWITLLAVLASSVCSAVTAEETSPPATAGGTEAPLPELEGVVVERPDGTFMTVTMEGPRVVLRFFDAKHQPIAPDVQRAFVKFRLSGRRPQNRTLLPGDDGVSLTHGRVLRPPFVFHAYITLVKEADGEIGDDDEDAEVEGEKYQVSFP